jgi:hypothetical protein
VDLDGAPADHAESGGLADKGTMGKRARVVPLILEIRDLVALRLGRAATPECRLFTVVVTGHCIPEPRGSRAERATDPSLVSCGHLVRRRPSVSVTSDNRPASLLRVAGRLCRLLFGVAVPVARKRPYGSCGLASDTPSRVVRNS